MQMRKTTSLVSLVAAIALAGTLPAVARGGGGGGHAGGGGGGRIGGGGFGARGAAFGGARQGGFGAAQRVNGGNANFAAGRGGRGFQRGFGYGGLGYGYGLDGYGYDGVDGGDYAYGGAEGFDGGDAGFGVQYSQGEDEGLQTGRSAAVVGGTCSTPVKACGLYTQSYVGQSCSCKVGGGRSRGQVTP